MTKSESIWSEIPVRGILMLVAAVLCLASGVGYTNLLHAKDKEITAWTNALNAMWIANGNTGKCEYHKNTDEIVCWPSLPPEITDPNYAPSVPVPDIWPPYNPPDNNYTI